MLETMNGIELLVPWRAARGILKWIGVVVGGLALCLLTFEIYLRITMPYKPNLGIYKPDFEIGKRLAPNFKGDHYGTRVQINSHGMRDREFALKKPAGTGRILVLGDSWTFGPGVAVEATWPKQLEAELTDEPARIQVMNTGVSGYETYNEAVYYKRDLGVFEHDLVLVGLYPVNDVHDKMSMYRREKALHDNHPLLYDLDMFPRRHLYVVQWLRQLRSERKLRRRAIFYGHPHATSHRFAEGETDWTNLYTDSFSGWRVMKDSLLSIGETARKRGVRGAVILFPDVADLTRYGAYCHPKVKPPIEKAVRDAGMVFIDSWPYFRPYKGREREIALDAASGATHLGPKGYEVLAHAIFEELLRTRLIDKETGQIRRSL